MLVDRWPLVTAAEMRELDRRTIEDRGVPAQLLMEVAGEHVARRAAGMLARGGRVRVVAGAGHNGGDGWVAARHLHLRGVPVEVVATVGADAWKGDAGPARARALAVGVAEVGALEAGEGDVVVDALLGTGLSRDVDAARARWIEAIHAARPAARVLAVDLPSGLCADTGQVRGAAVQADQTLTIGLPKLGLLFEPGRTLAGRVRVARIGIEDPAANETHPAVWCRGAVARALPERPGAGHKGRFGHVLVAAGSEGMTGAAALAARGAGRAGAGLVTVACPGATHDVLETLLPEAMTRPVGALGATALAPSAQAEITELAAERGVTVLGPGLGRASETRELVGGLLGSLAGPLVLDADGLFAAQGNLAALKAREVPPIVTPHPGEAAHLLATTPAEILADRPAAARALCDATGAVVVLKGAGTVIAEPDGSQGAGRLIVNPTGGPVLGTGGTGDVLAGVVGAFVAQGVPGFEAGVLGAYVHGAAGDRLAAERGEAGVLAGDVAEALPATLAALRAAPDEEMQGDVLAFPQP